MTVSDIESDVSLDDHHSWKTSHEFEQTSTRTKESHSSTGSSSQSFADPALDNTCYKLPAMNLVLKTRMSSRQNNGICDLQHTDTKSTMRTTSFTTQSTCEFGPKHHSIVEELTVTDDGPVEQKDLNEEEVYQKLSQLKIVPEQDAVPEFVSTPPEKQTSTRISTTPSTSACTSTSRESATITIKRSFSPEKDDSSDSDLSDISGFTGTFTTQKSVEFKNEDDASSVAVVPTAERSSSTFSQRLPFYPEEIVKTHLLQQAAAATTSARVHSTPKRKAKSVSFSTVSVREYQRILGDNPSCSCGPSIGIGWKFDSEDSFSVNQWEDWRQEERDATLLVLCREEREELLLELGYNQKVIAQAVRDIIKIKNKRRQTIHNLEAMAVEEMMESATKKLKSVRKRGIFGKRKKKKRNENDDEESLCA
jgi:hypothetical protein